MHILLAFFPILFFFSQPLVHAYEMKMSEDVNSYHYLHDTKQGSEQVKVILKKGQPVTILWKDGRKAQFKVRVNKADIISFDFKVQENECNYKINQKCQFRFINRIDYVSMVWVDHPDKKKIGTIVHSKTINKKWLDRAYYNFSNSFLHPKVLPNIPSVIKCNDYSWIPYGTKNSPPDKWHVYQWSTEETRLNQEINVFQPQLNSGGMHLTFKRNNKNELSLEKIPYLFIAKQKIYMNYLAFIADIVQMIVKNTNKEFCQLSIKLDVLSFLKELEKYNSKATKKDKIYIYGEDEALFDTPLMYGQLSMKEILKKIALLKLQ